MNRQIWAARGLTLVTLAVAAGANVAIATFGGLDPFLYALWMIVPAGAIVVAALATSGFVLGCRVLGARPAPADLPFLMAVCLALPLLILALEYAQPILAGHAWGELVPFGQFVAASVTDVKMVVHSRQFGDAPAQALGEFGWFVLVPRLAALLAVAKIVHTSCGGGRQAFAAFGAPGR